MPEVPVSVADRWLAYLRRRADAQVRRVNLADTAIATVLSLE